MILCNVAKIYCHLIILFSLCIFSPKGLLAETPRTDGPEGSEYGSPSLLEGELMLGARFGALLNNRYSSATSVLLGGDIDYRPLDLFGFQLSYHQGLQKKGRLALFNFTPIMHWEYSNLRPYALFGPGLAFYKQSGTQTKFSLNAGGGADFMLSENFGVGLNYTYHLLFDSVDRQSLVARVVYSFGR